MRYTIYALYYVIFSFPLSWWSMYNILKITKSKGMNWRSILHIKRAHGSVNEREIVKALSTSLICILFFWVL
jgi:hypothetical protein